MFNGGLGSGGMFGGGLGIPRNDLIFHAPLSNGLVDIIGESVIVIDVDSDLGLRHKKFHWEYSATMGAIDLALGGDALFEFGTETPISRYGWDWLCQPWMNKTYLFLGDGGAAGYSESQAANIARIIKYLRYAIPQYDFLFDAFNVPSFAGGGLAVIDKDGTLRQTSDNIPAIAGGVLAAGDWSEDTAWSYLSATANNGTIKGHDLGIADGCLIERTRINSIKNNRFSTLTSSGPDVFTGWVTTKDGTTAISKDTSDVPPGYGAACRFDIDALGSVAIIGQDCNRAVAEGDRPYISMMAKAATATALKLQISIYNGATRLYLSADGTAWGSSSYYFPTNMPTAWGAWSFRLPAIPTGYTAFYNISVARNGGAGTSSRFTSLEIDNPYGSPIINDTGSAKTVNGGVLSVPSSVINADAIGLFLQVSPHVATSLDGDLLGNYVDADNYLAILSDGSNIILRNRAAGVNSDLSLPHTMHSGTPIRLNALVTDHGMAARVSEYSGGWSDYTSWVTTSTPESVALADNIQIGALNSTNQCQGYYQAFATKKLSAQSTIAEYIAEFESALSAAPINPTTVDNDFIRLGVITDPHYSGTLDNPENTEWAVAQLNAYVLSGFIDLGDNYNPIGSLEDDPQFSASVATYDALLGTINTDNKMVLTGNHDYPYPTGEFADLWALDGLSQKDSAMVIRNYRIVNIFNAGNPQYTADAASLTYLTDQLALCQADGKQAIICMHVPLVGVETVLSASAIISIISAAQSAGVVVRALLSGHDHSYSYTANAGGLGVPQYIFGSLYVGETAYVLDISASAITVTAIT